MLELTFEGLFERPSHAAEERFILDGGTLRTAAGTPVAKFQNGCWDAFDSSFARLHLQGPLFFQFVEPTANLISPVGTGDAVDIRGPALYFEHQQIALLVGNNWHTVGRSWPIVEFIDPVK